MENDKLDIEQILEQVDVLYEANKGEEAEALMLRFAARAAEIKDDNVLLQLLNELLGYYRETSQEEKVFLMADRAIEQAERMGLKGTLPYATTLLNVATAYRACGKLAESMEYYLQVQEVYESALEPDDMYMAGLKNNISLLYQEMGDFASAKQRQLEALAIVEKKGSAYEQAVTYTNLAGSCMQLGEREIGYGYAVKAEEIFRREKVTDSHYGAALAVQGAWFYYKTEYGKAQECYQKAMEAVEKSLGRNAYYCRLRENAALCEGMLLAPQDGEEPDLDSREEGAVIGLALARIYYEKFGKPMIEEQFSDYAGRIAVGLCGRGSDCFGYDDSASRDHDWGPDFCMWLTDDTYEEIGEALTRAYEALPEEFLGCRRSARVNGRNRRGVIRISDFYRGLVGTEHVEEIDWRSVPDYALAAAVNGKVFRDDEGVFSRLRRKIQEGYPEEIRYLKLAESGAKFSQAAQYNYSRMLGRGDEFTARMMLWDGLKEAMKLQHYIEGKYPPHDKWLLRSLKDSEEGRKAAELLEKAAEDPVPYIEKLGEFLALELYACGYISDTDSYLDSHSEELLYKASLSSRSNEELAEDIAKLEFEAFDKVKNEGGRASCQNDWATFSIMRKSQYLTWNRTMLMQYLYDFHREYQRGHNLIEEKYGRMMESTAPEKYEEIKANFPELTEEKRNIIQQIVGLQVGWMEDFCSRYPAMAGNARKIHTHEDTAFDTSYETYLRGELGTYSDKMLELYGRYVVDCARKGGNLAFDIMGNTARLYGYKDVDDAEQKISGYWRS